jgi:hypothetical protein
MKDKELKAKEIHNWKENHKLYKKEFMVLLECFRRVYYFHKGNVNEKLCTCLIPSEAKQAKEHGYIKAANNEAPRVRNWYSLTEKGAKIVQDLKLKMTEELSLKIFDNFYCT